MTVFLVMLSMIQTASSLVGYKFKEKAKIKSSSRDGLQVSQLESSNPLSVFQFLSPYHIPLGHMFIFILEV